MGINPHEDCNNQSVNMVYLNTHRIWCIVANIFTMDDSSLSNLKTHDWHNFLKVDLTFFIANHSYPCDFFFRWITSKEIDISSIAQKKRECIELLCLMEKELPTSFFDIQVHVLIHLVDEIKIAGVVRTRWMFWVERFLGVLKGLVRQRARPEGSMSAEGWVLGECMYRGMGAWRVHVLPCRVP
ncbi:hypothetical protein L7F22_050730 [Adiantum nelumboides]|nr:hypothetical protein [Adiantum nelumboides]